jgi:tetratricopeptide (TPR) repeat protein
MTEAILQRAELLINQQRYEEAERVLSELLANEPDNIQVLATLSDVKLQLDKDEDARELIDSAIGIAPDVAYLYYIKAKVSVHLKRYDESEQLLQQAISLDPSDADYFSYCGFIKLARKQYEPALQLANKALEFDPENILALNTRSSALLKLNRVDESFATIDGALREDPGNTYTHANYGWNLLEKGDHNKALEHFKEALRNNPGNQFAQAGMMEALKARFMIYRWFLKYSFWMGNLAEKYQWAVLIGFFFGSKLLRNLARSNEALQPYLNPLIGLLALIAISTWVITPLSNLFLRMNSYGKHLLDKKEMQSSNFVGASLIVMFIGIAGYAVQQTDPWVAVAVFGFSMMVPLSSMFAPSKFKNAMVYYAGGLALAGTLAILLSFLTGELFNLFTIVYLFGFIAFQWIANFLVIRTTNL